MVFKYLCNKEDRREDVYSCTQCIKYTFDNLSTSAILPMYYKYKYITTSDLLTFNKPSL